MNPLLLDPADDLAQQNAKLRKINAVLMRRIEQELAEAGPGYSNFQRAAALEEQVRARTRDLDGALEMLSVANTRLNAARKEAEQARSDLYNAIESVQEGFALFDPQNVLIMCNSRFSAQLPDVAAKLGPGLNFVDYVRLVAQSQHLELPEGTTRQEWARQRLLSHSKPHVNFILRLTEDRWIQVSAQRTPANGTAVVQMDVSAMIESEREERDRLLDDLAQLLRATLDHITQGVVIFDARHHLAGWNQRLRALISLPLQLMQPGADFRAILHYLENVAEMGPEREMRALLQFATGAKGRQPLSLELRRGDGAILDVFCQEMPDQGFVISFTDMTVERTAVAEMHRAKEMLETRVAERTRELEEARDHAERAHTSKSRFVASASHDLLQPLNAAKLFLSSLTHTELDCDQRVIASRIQSAFESVESILGALLDISNLDLGAATADMACLPLGPLLSSLEQQYQPLARERGLDLRVMPCTAWVESDPAYLRRILQNLIGNAVRYTRKGRVLVGVRRRGDRLRIEVRDTGPGIPPERRADIFREFVRLDTSAGAPHGMGLGLAIVERACALLGHPLLLVSEPGRGTCFCVTVPLSFGGTLTADPAPALPHQAPPLEDMIIVIVEDDDAVRAGMASVLEDWGTSPLEAADAASAEALIADIGVAPDVIIADYRLGSGASGIEAIARLRALSGPVPAIVVSGDRSAKLRRLAAQHNIAVLHKPLELHRLRAVLRWARTTGSRAAE